MASTQPVLLHSLLFGHGTAVFLDAKLAITAAGGVCSPFELASTHYYYVLELEHWRSQEEAGKKQDSGGRKCLQFIITAATNGRGQAVSFIRKGRLTLLKDKISKKDKWERQ